jgi:hypothetical protein
VSIPPINVLQDVADHVDNHVNLLKLLGALAPNPPHTKSNIISALCCICRYHVLVKPPNSNGSPKLYVFKTDIASKPESELDILVGDATFHVQAEVLVAGEMQLYGVQFQDGKKGKKSYIAHFETELARALWCKALKECGVCGIVPSLDDAGVGGASGGGGGGGGGGDGSADESPLPSVGEDQPFISPTDKTAAPDVAPRRPDSEGSNSVPAGVSSSTATSGSNARGSGADGKDTATFPKAPAVAVRRPRPPATAVTAVTAVTAATAVTAVTAAAAELAAITVEIDTAVSEKRYGDLSLLAPQRDAAEALLVSLNGATAATAATALGSAPTTAGRFSVRRKSVRTKLSPSIAVDISTCEVAAVTAMPPQPLSSPACAVGTIVGVTDPQLLALCTELVQRAAVEDPEMPDDTEHTVFVAMAAYTAADQDELTIVAGTRLLVHRQDSDGWWLSSALDGSRSIGYAPATFLEAWLDGHVPRRASAPLGALRSIAKRTSTVFSSIDAADAAWTAKVAEKRQKYLADTLIDWQVDNPGVDHATAPGWQVEVAEALVDFEHEAIHRKRESVSLWPDEIVTVGV